MLRIVVPIIGEPQFVDVVASVAQLPMCLSGRILSSTTAIIVTVIVSILKYEFCMPVLVIKR